MKIVTPVLLLFAVISLCGCKQYELDDVSESLPETSSEKNLIEQDILVDIMTSRYGGYKKNKVLTRASKDFKIAPYINNGDTLMYVVQYSDGWELYSANKAAPMRLYSSPEGKFNLTDTNLPPALKALFNSTINNLDALKKAGTIAVNQSWDIVCPSDEELKAGKITIDEELLSKINKRPVSRSSGEPNDNLEEEEGHWVLLETEVVDQSSYISPKLIKTKWGQGYGWNTYCPFLWNDSTGSYNNAKVGCVAVAAGQYMYYTHYKDGIPVSTVDTATPTANGLDFTFNGNSSTIWDGMATFRFDKGLDNTALFLGYVGRQVKMGYGLTGSSSTSSKLISYLKDVYGVEFYSGAKDFNTIGRYIKKSNPIFADARAGKDGHCFIIDQYGSTSKTIKYTYGWEGPYDRYGNGVYEDTNDRDEDGNIIGWAVQNEITKTTSTHKISMNWGDGGNYDNIFYDNLYSWTVGENIFNKDITIFLRKDI